MPSEVMTGVIIITVLALAFDFINGFHDTANAVATSIGTRVLRPSTAITMAAILNLAGALVSAGVAKTIGSGIVSPTSVSTLVIVSTLISAIIWNLITWYFGIPSSSSHALIGSLLGAAIVYKGTFAVVSWYSFLMKIILWLILSPILGFIVGFLVMLLLLWILRAATPRFVTKFFSKAQIISAASMAFSHGSNDAQKSMGIITMALVSSGALTTFDVPNWVRIACAITMALGTALGGRRIIKTMGLNMARLTPVNGFAAETAAAAIILTATAMHAPVSTTHVISTSIMGVGATKRLSAVRWSVAKNIVVAWVMTIPICAVLAGLIIFVLEKIF
ncbi:MAG: anion permease [Deltaproteobacteria bacterium]